MKYDYNLSEGKKVADLIEEEKIEDFLLYIEKTCGSQKLTTRSQHIGVGFATYVDTVDEEEARRLVDKAFMISNANKIDVLRIARHLAANYSRYKNNDKLRKTYLSMNRDTDRFTFDCAMIVASKSSLSCIQREYKI